MSYVDLNTIHNPATGTVAPAAWGDQIRENFEFLVDPPVCSVFHSTTQSVATGGTGTIMSANSENFDNDAMHSTVSNTSRITAQTAGRYLLTANADFASNTTGTRQIQFRLNGSTFFATVRINAITGGFLSIVQTTATVVLAVGDYVETNLFQNSGGSLNSTLREFAALYLTR